MGIMDRSITQQEHDAIVEEMKGKPSVRRLRSIIKKLLGKVEVYGQSVYDPKFGDEKLCVCGHVYYRHFDTYDDMSPVGCKYCRCETGFQEAK